jgi:hypothetical protein
LQPLAELAGLNLRWKVESMGSIPYKTERSYVRHNGDEPVVRRR